MAEVAARQETQTKHQTSPIRYSQRGLTPLKRLSRRHHRTARRALPRGAATLTRQTPTQPSSGSLTRPMAAATTSSPSHRARIPLRRPSPTSQPPCSIPAARMSDSSLNSKWPSRWCPTTLSPQIIVPRGAPLAGQSSRPLSGRSEVGAAALMMAMSTRARGSAPGPGMWRLSRGRSPSSDSPCARTMTATPLPMCRRVRGTARAIMPISSWKINTRIILTGEKSGV